MMKEPPFTLSQCKVAIFGLGLMGGSLALALRGHCSYIIGIDTDPLAGQLAREMKAVDDAGSSASLAIEADLIILAVPVMAIIDLLQKMDLLFSKPAVILDIGSTKQQITQAMLTLPERFDPIGGHPMCGKEYPSIRYAEAALFQDAPFALTPLPRTSARARHLAAELVEVIGAHALWLDPELHDQWVAYTSHLPYLVANALAEAVPLQSAGMVGTGFRSTTRLAGGFTPMMLDVLLTNRDNVLMAMQDFQIQMEHFIIALKNNDHSALLEQLQNATLHRNLLLNQSH